MNNFNFHQHLLQVLVTLLAFVLLNEHNCRAIKLNPNGGYDIVIGVEDNTPEPLNVNNFLDEIRSGMHQFSTELWKATHRRFFINSVDVVVPGNWWTSSNFQTASWQTLMGSEIRITHDIGSPNVVNPNTCGTSGLYVEIPDNFFQITKSGQHGAVGKALVNLWARYRFGVWDEHGIPGDTKFPYFYAHPSFEPKWEATGCSNEEIAGSFRNIDGEISDRCDVYGSDIPDDDCRFIPSPANNANSSLMHFHWLDSISEFCDSKTHNHVAPNRQNLFCGHRSVWEVIRESDDYKSTKVCMDTVERPEFRVLKESRSPEFYILLDRGVTVTPERVLQEVMGALVKFVSLPSLEQINIAVGTYPHANQGKNHYYVKEEVGWAPISSVIYDIESVLGASSNPDGPVIRDFGLAIQEVAEKIKQRNHLAGTVILVVKRGASPNLFDKITFEQEVIASIKEDNRIEVFAIEAQQGEKSPYTNLQTLTEATSGQYHVINDTVNTAKKLERLFSAMYDKLEQSSIMNSLTSWTTQKQFTDPEKVTEIPIYDNANMVKVHLTTNRQMVASDIYFEQLSGEHATVEMTEKGEWDENSDLSRRSVFTYTISNPSPGSVWSLRHGCHTEKATECRFFLVVTAHSAQPTHPHISESAFNSHYVTIDVSTSATEHSYLDMSNQGFNIVPFAIYATIEMEQQRVLGLKNVTALVRLDGEHDNHLGDWVVPLADDGLGLPDIAEYDGIYSGIFTPLEDGLYQISVAASGVSEPSGFSTFQDLRIVNHAGSLIQIHQQSFGCKNSSKSRCISAVPRGSFSRVQDLRRAVAVENSAAFKPGKPTKILDFSVTTLPDYNVEFAFTSPKLLGSDDDPDEFMIYMAPHVDNFIGSTDSTNLVVSSLAEPSGSRIKIRYNAESKAIPFFAVEAVYRGQKGGPSNVVGVVPSEEGSITPSTTTTARTTSLATSTLPPTGPSTTTEYPWPTTTPTTESPFPTTTDESEEIYYPFDPYTSTTESTSTTEGSEVTASTTSRTTTNAPTTTENSEILTEVVPTTTTEDSGVTGSSSTTEPTTTTMADLGVTETSSSTTTAPIIVTGTSGLGSSSSTTEAPSTTTQDSEVSHSSSTAIPSTTTTEESDVTQSSSTTSPTTLATEKSEAMFGSSTTLAPTTTSKDFEVTFTPLTTLHPSTTPEDADVTASSTTSEPTDTTTDNYGIIIGSLMPLDPTSTTTENSKLTISPSPTWEPLAPTQYSQVSASSPTTLAPITTEDLGAGVSSATTQESTITTDHLEVISSSSTTLAPTTTWEVSGIISVSSATLESTTTDDSGVSSSSSTTLSPVSAGEDSDVTTSLPNTLSTTKTENIELSSSTTTTPVSSEVAENLSTPLVSSTTTEDTVSGSSSTISALITTTEDAGGINDISSTTLASTTTTEDAGDSSDISSTTYESVTTTEDTGVGGSSPTTPASTTTTEGAGDSSDISSTTYESVTTTEDTGVGGTSSTTRASTTTTEDTGDISDISSTTYASTTTTEDAGHSSDISSTTLASTTTPEDVDINSSSSTTLASITTTEESGEKSDISSTTLASTTTTEESGDNIDISSITLASTTTTEDLGISSSSSTTLASTTTTEDLGISSSSSTTLASTTTTEESGDSNGLSSTTLASTTTTEESGDSSDISSTTLASTTTTEESGGNSGISSTTLASTTTMANFDISSSTTTTEESVDSSGISSTTLASSTTTEDSGISSSSSTTLPSTTVTEESGDSSGISSTTLASSTTTEDSGINNGSSTTFASTTATEKSEDDSSDISSTSTTEESGISGSSSTSFSSTTTTEVSYVATRNSSIPNGDVSSPSIASSTAVTSSTITTGESSASSPLASFKMVPSETLLSILTLSIIYFQIC